jgi:hypothetical protein
VTTSATPCPARSRADGEGRYRLIIARASWLAREHFARFIRIGASINDPGTKLASIDWEAAISALDAGELPSSGGFSEQWKPSCKVGMS